MSCNWWSKQHTQNIVTNRGILGINVSAILGIKYKLLHHYRYKATPLTGPLFYNLLVENLCLYRKACLVKYIGIKVHNQAHLKLLLNLTTYPVEKLKMGFCKCKKRADSELDEFHRSVCRNVQLSSLIIPNAMLHRRCQGKTFNCLKHNVNMVELKLDVAILVVILYKVFQVSRAVAKASIGGGGVYSYIRVMPD